MTTYVDQTRRWRIMREIRTGPERQDWHVAELAQLPPHTSYIEAIMKGIEAYQKLILDQPDLTTTMFVRVDEFWLDDDGEVDEFYQAWSIGDQAILESNGELWNAPWPPAIHGV